MDQLVEIINNSCIHLNREILIPTNKMGIGLRQQQERKETYTHQWVIITQGCLKTIT